MTDPLREALEKIAALAGPTLSGRGGYTLADAQDIAREALAATPAPEPALEDSPLTRSAAFSDADVERAAWAYDAYLNNEVVPAQDWPDAHRNAMRAALASLPALESWRPTREEVAEIISDMRDTMGGP